VEQEKLDKLETLQRIDSEDKFREKVLIPLFDKMGLAPVHTHGTNERGKDIVCKEENAFGNREWLAIVVKIGKITGSTSGTSGFQTVLNQIKEAFDYPYKDPNTKNNVSINKVQVITNDKIIATAQEKIVDKLGAAGAEHANVHFLGDEKLSALIDEHWSDFWRISADMLADQDQMTEDAGLVLYVLARAHVGSQSGIKKKVEPALDREKIHRQTGLSNVKVDAALTYLVQTLYVQEMKKKTYCLHPRKTVGYLLVDPNQIRLLFAIRGIITQELRFTEEKLVRESKKEVLSFTPQFVKETLVALEKGEYIENEKARGKGHFTLKMHTVDDERPYLNRWLKHLGRVPTEGL